MENVYVYKYHTLVCSHRNPSQSSPSSPTRRAVAFLEHPLHSHRKLAINFHSVAVPLRVWRLRSLFELASGALIRAHAVHLPTLQMQRELHPFSFSPYQRAMQTDHLKKWDTSKTNELIALEGIMIKRLRSYYFQIGLIEGISEGLTVVFNVWYVTLRHQLCWLLFHLFCINTTLWSSLSRNPFCYSLSFLHFLQEKMCKISLKLFKKW